MTVKAEEEWTEDEKRMAQDYMRKVRELAEERDKYRKVSYPYYVDRRVSLK